MQAGLSIGVFIACVAASLPGALPAAAQTVPDKVLMVEDVFKNVQVLKGISVVEFMDTMGFFSASLGYNCTNCHGEDSLGNWAKYAEDNPVKRTARRMVQMMNAINKENYGARRVVTCYTCHRGGGLPKEVPSLLEQYSEPPPEDPNEIEISRQAQRVPSAEQVLDKYIEALGGAERVAVLKSFIAKGTYTGFDTNFQKMAFEMFAEAPDKRTTVARTPLGESVTVFDGRLGWIAAPDRPVALLAVPAGPDLDGMKLDAVLAFPAGIKQALTQWRTGFSATKIDGRDMDVVQGTTAGGSRVKLFFDKQAGLLVRSVRFADSVVGINPVEVDYSDYRETAGVKMPYKWTVTWTDGQSTIELSEVQANAVIEAGRFRRPAPATN